MGKIDEQMETVSFLKSAIYGFRGWFERLTRAYREIFYSGRASVSAFCVGDRVRIINRAEQQIYECPFPIGSEFFIVDAFLCDGGMVYLLCKYQKVPPANLQGFVVPLLPAVDWMIARVEDPAARLLGVLAKKL